MTDNFALFGEARRPWLDPESIKGRFLALSAELHPDRVHGAGAAEKETATKRFADLNSGYHCLREPKERLRHLLELERGCRPADLHPIPQDLADLFMELAALCKQVDAFLQEKQRLSSPLLQAQLFETGQDWADKLNTLQGRIDRREQVVLAEVQSLDAAWMAGNPGRDQSLSKLEELWRLLGFFGRWKQQIGERTVQIAL
jgi:DnaJ-domain-containing protein 1